MSFHVYPDQTPVPFDVEDFQRSFDEPSSMTMEGYINGLGKLSRATGWRRVVAKVMAIAMLLPFAAIVIGFGVFLVQLLTNH
jgi:hypothetical protein